MFINPSRISNAKQSCHLDLVCSWYWTQPVAYGSSQKQQQLSEELLFYSWIGVCLCHEHSCQVSPLLNCYFNWLCGYYTTSGLLKRCIMGFGTPSSPKKWDLISTKYFASLQLHCSHVAFIPRSGFDISLKSKLRFNPNVLIRRYRLR